MDAQGKRLVNYVKTLPQLCVYTEDGIQSSEELQAVYGKWLARVSHYGRLRIDVCGLFVCSLSFQFIKMDNIVRLFMISQKTVTTTHSGVRSVK